MAPQLLFPRPVLRVRTTLLLLCLGALGCGDGDVYAPTDAVERIPEERARSTPPPPLPCPEAPLPGAPRELASVLGRLGDVTLHPCGHLSWIDPSGDLFATGPALEAPARLASGVTSARLARRGDQAWVRRGDEHTWRALDGDGRFTMEAEATGFVRHGDGELAWACADGALGTVDADGFHPKASAVRLCERVLAAAEAPRLVFVGDDLALHAVDLAAGTVSDLSEVAYIAASSDRLALSRDGRILYHQPGRVPSPHIGVFDLWRAPGERQIGAARVIGDLSGIVHAPAGAHAAAMPTEEGVALVGPDGAFRFRAGAVFAGLSPEGDRALLIEATDVPGIPWNVSVSSLGREGEREPVGTLEVPLTRFWRSPGAGALVGWGSSPDASDDALHAAFRWRDERLRVLPDPPRSPRWVGDDGATLTRHDGHAVVRAFDGEELHRWPEEWGAVAFALDGAVLVWLRGPEHARLVVASTTGPNEHELYAGPSPSRVQVDRAGQRVLWVRVAPDEDDPSQLRTRIWAGALP